jgi:subtilisin family serine protease
MKVCQHLIICLLMLSFLGSAGTVVAQGNHVPGQAVMKLIAGGRPDDVLRGRGAIVNDSIPGYRTYLLEIDPAEDWESVMAEIEADTQVIFVEPNFSVELPENYQMSISFPDDYVPPLLEGIQPASFYDQPPVYTLGIDEAQQTATGEGVIVGVIDNGVDFDHPLLSPRLMASGYDFIDRDTDPSYEPGAVAAHGSFVSGLIALTAPDCQLLPFRAFDGDGVGNTYAIANAIHHAVNHDADVINMSFGTGESCRILEQACNAAVAAGISMVAASGNNSSSSPTFPAALPGVIVVSGIDPEDLLTDFSNYGDYIDVCAPAVDLYSILIGETGWGTWSGTSFAAPFVSATCAMLWEITSDYSTFLMQEHIRQTAAIDLQWGTLEAPDPAYGYGRLDVASAVTQAELTGTEEYGDLDGNGSVNAGDVVYLVQYIYSGGPPPVAPGNADVNCDGIVNGYDIEYFVNRIYRGGPRNGRCN